MARCKDKLKPGLAKLDGAGFRQELIRCWRDIVPETHCGGISYHRRQNFSFALVEFRFKAILVEHKFVAQYMVYMAMRIEQQHRLKVVGFDKTYHHILLLARVHARVYDCALAGVIEQ